MAKALVKLTPGVWLWSQHLVANLFWRFQPSGYVGNCDQIRQSHDKLVLRRAIIFPACWLLASLAPTLVLPWITRMASPLIPPGRRCLQHPLWLDPRLGAWPSGSHASSLLGDFALVGDVGHRKSPNLSKRGGVCLDQRLAEWSRLHALLECIDQHFFIFGRRPKAIQVVSEGLSLILPYTEQDTLGGALFTMYCSTKIFENC